MFRQYIVSEVLLIQVGKHIVTIHWYKLSIGTLHKLSVRTLGYYGNQTMVSMGGSPGLVVIGGDSCSEGHGFEFRRHILDGHDIFHIDLF